MARFPRAAPGTQVASGDGMMASTRGMSWSGVGPKMAAVILPALAAAIALLVVRPAATSIPIAGPVRMAVGGLWLVAGVAFWVASGATFLRRFHGTSLVTTGPYGWCRHPIYASAIVFVLPATALLADAWSFLLVDLLLWLAFRVFIGEEDLELAKRFGATYHRYRAEVPQLLPRPPALRRARDLVPPSVRLDAWLPGAPFRDTIVVRSRAAGPALLRAIEEVTPRDMPLADLLGRLRYAGGKASTRIDRGAPFLRGVVESPGSVLLERTDDELVVGTIGKLHQIRDQQMVASVRTPEDFLAFEEPDHEKLVMSIRAIPAGAHETRLAFEHRTRATDACAERRFARYWIAIRPGGAFVTRQLLRAAARLAEHPRATSQRRRPLEA